MTKKQLITKLKEYKKISLTGDIEDAHYQADKLLLEFIDDKEIKRAFTEISKCYA